MVSAGPKQKKAETWIDASVKAKTELQAKLKKSGMPIVSTWMKHKAKAEPFVVDLKGVDKLVLVTAGGPDGTDYAQAVWANARLIKADGTAVWLDEVPYEYGVAGWAKPKMNTNAYDHENTNTVCSAMRTARWYTRWVASMSVSKPKSVSMILQVAEVCFSRH